MVHHDAEDQQSICMLLCFLELSSVFLLDRYGRKTDRDIYFSEVCYIRFFMYLGLRRKSLSLDNSAKAKGSCNSCVHFYVTS